MKTDEQVLVEWLQLVNMSAAELDKYRKSTLGKKSGLTKAQAEKQGIGRGQDSAKAIIRMKRKGPGNWNATDWRWARRQVSFIKRMRGNRGPLFDAKGEPTRKLMSLLIWGHNPL